MCISSYKISGEKMRFENLEMGSEREMVLDLSSIEVFEEDQIDFDKRVTFIFGKNGTGKIKKGQAG